MQLSLFLPRSLPGIPTELYNHMISPTKMAGRHWLRGIPSQSGIGPSLLKGSLKSIQLEIHILDRKLGTLRVHHQPKSAKKCARSEVEFIKSPTAKTVTVYEISSSIFFSPLAAFNLYISQKLSDRKQRFKKDFPFIIAN